MLRRSTFVLAGPSGVSGMAVYCPPCRVDLKNWCAWGGQSFEKVSAVVGQSFRVCTDKENGYTMAASAVLRLILNYNIDPTRVGQLNLGTESSTDNSAGSVIVKGMVDMALADLGMPRLARNCDVQEVKHACLGGMYALQNAARYCQYDGDDRVAIAVASDIASYVKNSTGEVTSGAGAVAMLVERKPKLFEMDLNRSGSASAYRSHDFRKPFTRHFTEGYGSYSHGNFKVKDWPVFSGPYSTIVYTDTVCAAVEDMLLKMHAPPGEYYKRVQAIFMHRPYQGMPVAAMAALYARALARAHSDEHKQQFAALCAAAKVKPEDVVREIEQVKNIDFFQYTLENQGKNPNVTPATDAIAKAIRKDKAFTTLLDEKMSLGSKTVAHLGNLYTGSLPAWIAAGFEEALQKYPLGAGRDMIAGSPMVAIGYGSGDAAISCPITPEHGWQEAASKINVTAALEKPALDLTQEQYEGIHSGKITSDLAKDLRKLEFVIDRLGTTNDAAFQDLGVEYYKFIQ